MKFKKYNVGGRDFLILNHLDLDNVDKNHLARIITNKYLGFGGEGIIVYKEEDGKLENLIFYNNEGDEENLYGTGIIAISKFLFDKGYFKLGENKLGIKGQNHIIEIANEGEEIRICLGQVKLESKDIPIKLNLDKVIGEAIEVAGYEYIFSSLNIVYPETMIFVQKINDSQINYLGQQIENNKIFPEKTNVNFVTTNKRNEINIYSWKRNKGRVISSETGGAAAVVAGSILDTLDSIVKVKTEGGDFLVEYKDGKVYITGKPLYIGRGDFNFN